MIVAGSDYWNMAFGKAPGEVEEDSEGLVVISKFGANVANIINKMN